MLNETANFSPGKAFVTLNATLIVPPWQMVREAGAGVAVAIGAPAADMVVVPVVVQRLASLTVTA